MVTFIQSGKVDIWGYYWIKSKAAKDFYHLAASGQSAARCSRSIKVPFCVKVAIEYYCLWVYMVVFP